MDRVKPLVFVAMPFGRKWDTTRTFEIDFDDVYERGIKPAVARDDLEIIRADEEQGGGIIHLAMFERLLLAEVAIVDVTNNNANVFYELGVRHAALPRSTIIIAANSGSLPFDITLIRTVPYRLEDGKLTDEAAAGLVKALQEQLENALAERDVQDSPLFQLIPQFPGIHLSHEVTENFRDRARYIDGTRQRLVAARELSGKEAKLAAVHQVEDDLGPITQANAEVAVDLLVAYRDLEEWTQTVRFAESLPEWLRESSVPIREQYALALNRLKTDEGRAKALGILQDIVAKQGDSPETDSLIGRIYKDKFNQAVAAGQTLKASGFLDQAIDWYRRGFNTDPRDYYPGVNLATLLARSNTPEAKEELQRVVPAVAFAVARLGGMNSQDYWQVATVLELAVLGGEWDTAMRALQRIAALNTTPMNVNSTADNLKLYESIHDAAGATRVQEIAQQLRGLAV
jgi:tetratricopeptide (TPR) repeat protein